MNELMTHIYYIPSADEWLWSMSRYLWENVIKYKLWSTPPPLKRLHRVMVIIFMVLTAAGPMRLRWLNFSLVEQLNLCSVKFVKIYYTGNIQMLVLLLLLCDFSIFLSQSSKRCLEFKPIDNFNIYIYLLFNTFKFLLIKFIFCLYFSSKTSNYEAWFLFFIITNYLLYNHTHICKNYNVLFNYRLLNCKYFLFSRNCQTALHFKFIRCCCCCCYLKIFLYILNISNILLFYFECCASYNQKYLFGFCSLSWKHFSSFLKYFTSNTSVHTPYECKILENWFKYCLANALHMQCNLWNRTHILQKNWISFLFFSFLRLWETIFHQKKKVYFYVGEYCINKPLIYFSWFLTANLVLFFSLFNFDFHLICVPFNCALYYPSQIFI